MAVATCPRWLRRCAAVVGLAVLTGGCASGKFGDFSALSTTTSVPSAAATTVTTAPAGATTTTVAGPTTPSTAPVTTANTGTAASTPPTQPVVTGARTDATASNLKASPGCDSGRPVVHLTWTPAGGAEQTVAVSSRPDGLDSGNFTSSETLAATRNSYDVREVQAGAPYYWRVLTRRASGLAASETSQFLVSAC